ncbi:MAG: PrsW family intramembrane metalloprotease, partial [Candidatus Kariarchaeaceae archaeon]
RYRWAYYLLLIILGIQSFLLLQNDPRFILILGAALIPGILYLSYVRNSDVGGKEPRGVIALHMILGILIIYPAIFLEGLGIDILIGLGFVPGYDFSFSSMMFWILFALLVVAPVEEGLKLLASLFGNLFHSENDQATDTIVYTVSVAAGFALFENYRYVFGSIGGLSVEDSLTLAIARSFTAIPLHLGMGLLMGYFLSGYYHPRKFGIGRFRRMQLLWRAFLFPTLLHGLYDLVVFLIFFNFTLQVIAALLFIIVVTIYVWRQVWELRRTKKYRFLKSL